MSDLEPTSAELEDVAHSLRQNAWLLGEYWTALRSAGLPDDVAGQILIDYHSGCVLPEDE